MFLVACKHANVNSCFYHNVVLFDNTFNYIQIHSIYTKLLQKSMQDISTCQIKFMAFLLFAANNEKFKIFGPVFSMIGKGVSICLILHCVSPTFFTELSFLCYFYFVENQIKNVRCRKRVKR